MATKQQRQVNWAEYGDTDLPVAEARRIYNAANQRGDRRASAAALQNIIRNEGRLAAQYAPIYWASVVAGRMAFNAGATDSSFPTTDLKRTGELDSYLDAVRRGE